MGCPNAIITHFAGLQEVNKIVFNSHNFNFLIEIDLVSPKIFIEKQLKIVSKSESREFKLTNLQLAK